MNGDRASVVARAPRFSIITVCFNAMPVLHETLASIRAQTCRDFEWVVVDGASTDGSATWLAAQSPDVFISEKDEGIYDAMNKAVALARGDWLFFLNAGDAFASGTTLANVLASIESTQLVDVVYGDVLYFGERGERRRRFHWLTRRRLLFGDLCHQAALVRRALFERIGPYDTTLRYNADFDWFLRAFHAGVGLRYLPLDIARFHDAGAHVQAGALHAEERNAVRSRYLPLPVWRIGNLALRVEHRIRRMLGQTI